MKQGCIDTEKWIRKGRKNQLKHLMDLLSKSTISEGFKGICDFDSDVFRPVGSEESPPNLWALTLVTLVSIAIAIPRTDRELIEPLLHGVHEGLRCMRFIEKKLDLKGLVNIKEAAHIIWQGVDLNHKWLDVDLSTLIPEEKDPKKIIGRLAEIGKDCVLDFEKTMAPMCGNKKTLKWTAKALAANSLYRICQTILDDYENKFGSAEELFEWLCVTISNILGARLTNLRMRYPSNALPVPSKQRKIALGKQLLFLAKLKTYWKLLDTKGFKIWVLINVPMSTTGIPAN
ncbi:uncharacterized protein LOC131254298 [Magnolia sinica]|uniref:uncharacterized protein LOC131254298 n=1 Tax=Magnolia sinica TaxID=86752 RepID=UPI00265B62D8|nr:uncharacterized protein LOC131254298 [Magnolia sinica]